MISPQRRWLITLLFLLFTHAACADDKPVVGLIPHARQPMVIDGKLDEWKGAFVTPLNATHPDFENRATQIYYLWDEQALYIGLRAIDALSLDSNGATKKHIENASIKTIDDAFRIWRGEWETYDLPTGIYTLALTARNEQGQVIVERKLHVLLEQQ